MAWLHDDVMDCLQGRVAERDGGLNNDQIFSQRESTRRTELHEETAVSGCKIRRSNHNLLWCLAAIINTIVITYVIGVGKARFFSIHYILFWDLMDKYLTGVCATDAGKCH